VIDPIPSEARRLLDEASFCYLAARSPAGPHLTPVVFAVHGARLWATTSRGSVKARLWRRDPMVGGLVRANGRSLTFSGSVETYDLLDPGTWGPSLRSAPTLSLAAAAFTRRNARFFAGYAVDAPRIPLAWSPPGRVFVGIGIEQAAALGDGTARRWGMRPRRVSALQAFRRERPARHPLRDVPAQVRDRIGEGGDATLALDGVAGLRVMPVRWILAGRSVRRPSPLRPGLRRRRFGRPGLARRRPRVDLEGPRHGRGDVPRPGTGPSRARASNGCARGVPPRRGDGRGSRIVRARDAPSEPRRVVARLVRGYREAVTIPIRVTATSENAA
jgi:hypothetical protein